MGCGRTGVVPSRESGCVPEVGGGQMRRKDQGESWAVQLPLENWKN